MRSSGKNEQALVERPPPHIRANLLLLICEQPAHGYDLLDRLAELGTGAVESGSIYRNLRGMEADKLIRSEWQVSDRGPARRVYWATDHGVHLLSVYAQAVSDSHEGLLRYLSRYWRLASTAGLRASA